MREILFKAKRNDNGEWVEGHYYSQVYHEGTIEEEWYHFIKPIGSKSWESIRVKPETICQSTGIYDNNRIMIFENDIVCHKYNTYEDDESEDFLTVRKEKKKNYVIKFDSTPSFMGYRYHNGRNIFPFKKGTVWNGNDEVVGNIHDNPELLGGSE